MIKELVHGGDIYSLQENQLIKKEDIIDFSANINPLGLPQGVKDAIVKGLEEAIHYPDPLCRKLLKALSEHEQISERFMVCGNGAADIIFKLVHAVKPKKALLLSPTFSEYEMALQTVKTEISYYTLLEEEGFKVKEDLLTSITSEIDILFLCNPNNPTGEVIEKELLQAILQRCNEKEVLLVVDECFNDFLDQPEAYSLKPCIEKNKNLFILKAFTKLYAMPGIRLGYGITCNETLLDETSKMGQPWSVSTIAQTAGIAALKEKDYVASTKKLIYQERHYLKEELSRLQMKVFDSRANYIFFKSPHQINLKLELQPQGLLIRSCANYHQIGNDFYRVAVKVHQDNEKLIKALEQILHDKMN